MLIEHLLTINKSFCYKESLKSVIKKIKKLNCDYLDDERRISNYIFVDKNLSKGRLVHIWKDNLGFDSNCINIIHFNPKLIESVIKKSLGKKVKIKLDVVSELIKKLNSLLITSDNYYSNTLSNALDSYEKYCNKSTHTNFKKLFSSFVNLPTSNFDDLEFKDICGKIVKILKEVSKIKEIFSEKLLENILNIELIIGKNNVGNISITIKKCFESSLMINEKMGDLIDACLIKDKNRMAHLESVASVLLYEYNFDEIIDLKLDNQRDFSKQNIDYINSFKIITLPSEKDIIFKNIEFYDNQLENFESILCYFVANNYFIHDSYVDFALQSCINKTEFYANKNDFFIHSNHSCFSTREHFMDIPIQSKLGYVKFDPQRVLQTHDFRYRFLELYYYQITCSIYSSLCVSAYSLIARELQYISTISLKIKRNNLIHNLNMIISEIITMYNQNLTLLNHDINYFLKIYMNEKSVESKYNEIKSSSELLWQESNITNGKDIGGYSLIISFVSLLGSIFSVVYSVNFSKDNLNCSAASSILSFNYFLLIAFVSIFLIISIVSFIYFIVKRKKH